MKLKKFNIFEFIGVYLGDGSIIFQPAKRVYKFELSGNADDEKDYFHKIAHFLRNKFGVNPKVFTKYEKNGKTLKLIVDNKHFASFLMNNLRLKFKNKAFTAKIPNSYLEWHKLKHVIRGLFETDGCLYFTRTKPHYKADYPRIEIKTASKILALQITSLLRKRGFRVNQRTSDGESAIGIYLSGDKMLKKWVKEIGFSKVKTYTKHQIYKQLGFYIPYSTLQERLDILRGGGQAAKLHFRR